MAGLTAAQKRRFEEDGVLTVEGVLTPEEVETLRRACGEVEEMAQGLTTRTPAIHPRILPTGRRVVDIVKGAVFQHPQFLAACTHPGVLDIVESLVGPDIQHHHSKLNWKPPLPPEQAAQGWKIGWHQDYAFFPHTNYDLPACAIYLDDTNLENGCMNVIPGSHREGPRNHMKDGAFSGVCQEPDAYADESRWRTVEVPAGGISLHHCLMLHSSGPNHSQRARRTFVIQYRAADNVQIAGRTSHLGWGFQVRGQNHAMIRFEDGVTCPLPEGLTSH